MAKGADTLAVRFAVNKYNLALKEFPADWNGPRMYHHVELLQIRMEAIMH